MIDSCPHCELEIENIQDVWNAAARFPQDDTVVAECPHCVGFIEIEVQRMYFVRKA